ncbi:hypothetical protein JMM81_03270 [Bacillus sp. V3B]|uniref:hypothetical protein n=1 Tax=Bacillus sp. V3B TaxID=2804915 RepID=UPI00210B760F|nr:hypothetical protein [Bacillus sp. V3B]MCQ6273999.1 hypothetical protein [Bacillus sp. V3B]
MTLLYYDFAHLFPRRNGKGDSALAFYTVTAFAHISQPKGIFIPLYKDSGELKEAIEHGAIAAVWDEEIPLPSYTPTYFHIFYTNDLWKGLKNMLEQYGKKLAIIEELDQNERTKFYFSSKNSLNERKNTYDIAVMTNECDQLMKEINDGRGE